MIKKTLEHIWAAKVWIIITALFLLIIHCLFKIHPKNDFFSAVWEAGDLISFIGTIVLGYVAYSQTKSASKMAEQADNMNKEFLRMQEREYVPVIKCLKDNFCGVKLYDSFDKHSEISEVKLCVAVLNKKDSSEDSSEELDKDPYVGYFLTIINNKETIDYNYISNRTYEMHLQYIGKYGISDVTVSSLSFYNNNDLVKEWQINEQLNTSFDTNDVIPFFINMMDSSSSKLLEDTARSNKMVLNLIMHCYDGTKYIERMCITKHFVEDEIPSLKKREVELMVSANYKVEKQD